MRLYPLLRSTFVAQRLLKALSRSAYYVPPFVRETIRYILSDREYMPDGWSTEDSRIKGWNDESVARAQEKHWPTLVGNLQGSGPLGVSHLPSRTTREDRADHNTLMSYAYVLTLAARKRDSLTLLDWGGGVGHYYLYSRALLPEVRIDYHCFDVPCLCRLGRRLLPEVRFYENAADVFEKQYDLVISSSSLHYFEDWRKVVGNLSAVTGKFLYIARLQTVLSKPSFVIVQRPYSFGYFTEYLSWCLNRIEFLNCVKEAGMELVREFVFDEDWLARGAPEKGQSRGFLFLRRSAYAE